MRIDGRVEHGSDFAVGAQCRHRLTRAGHVGVDVDIDGICGPAAVAGVADQPRINRQHGCRRIVPFAAGRVRCGGEQPGAVDRRHEPAQRGLIRIVDRQRQRPRGRIEGHLRRVSQILTGVQLNLDVVPVRAGGGGPQDQVVIEAGEAQAGLSGSRVRVELGELGAGRQSRSRLQQVVVHQLQRDVIHGRAALDGLPAGCRCWGPANERRLSPGHPRCPPVGCSRAGSDRGRYLQSDQRLVRTTEDSELCRGHAPLFVADREVPSARRVDLDAQPPSLDRDKHFAPWRRIRFDQSRHVPHRFRTGDRDGARMRLRPKRGNFPW